MLRSIKISLYVLASGPALVDASTTPAPPKEYGYCSDGFLSSCKVAVTTAEECEAAAQSMGLTWRKAEHKASEVGGCHEADMESGGDRVYFNSHSGNDKAYGHKKICECEPEDDEESESSPLVTILGLICCVGCCGGIGFAIWVCLCKNHAEPMAKPAANPTPTISATPVQPAPQVPVAQAVPVAQPAVAQAVPVAQPAVAQAV